MNRLGDFWNEGCAALLRNALETKGLSFGALAIELRVTGRTVQNWATSDARPKRPSVDTLPPLAEAVGLDVDAFRAAAEAFVRTGSLDVAVEAGRSWGRSDPIASAEAISAAATVGEEVVPARKLWSRSVVGSVAAVALLIAAAGLFFERRASPTREEAHPVGYSIPSHDENYEEAWAGRVSPDGLFIAFSAIDRTPTDGGGLIDAPRRIFVLRTDSPRRPVPVRGTEGMFTTYFWDARGRGLYFVRSRKLMHVAIDGGPPKEIAEVGTATYGDSNAAGDVVLGSRLGLVFVSASGRMEQRKAKRSHLFPVFLPGGERFLFVAQRRDAMGNAKRDLYVMSYHDRVPKLVEHDIPSRVEYRDGYVLYVRDCVLLARRFDLESERLGPEEFKVRDDVWMEDVSGSASFSTSENGVLVTQAPAAISRLQRIHLATRGIERESLPIDNVRSIAVIRDPRTLVLARIDRCKQTQAIWRWPLDGAAPRCLTCGRSSSTSPVVTSDGSSVYFAARRGTDLGIYSMAFASLIEHKVFESDNFPAPRDITPDGGRLVIEMTADRDGSLWTIPTSGATSAMPAVVTPEAEGEAARLSPDGRMLAFSAIRESGSGIFVVEWERPESEPRLVGPRGWRCRWSRDGKKIYYIERRAVMEYDFARGNAVMLFEFDANITDIAVADDTTFYAVTTAEAHNRVESAWVKALPAVQEH